MEVLVGSRFGIGTAGSYVRDRSGIVAQDKAVSAALFLKEESRRIDVRSAREEFTESSSSIGESSDNEEEEDDAVSSHGGEWLGSLASSLEDSLPIKRGLSNHYMGKSKSFGNLMEARDFEKVESPLNKRRRLVIANKFRIRSSLSSRINPNSMPLLALQESDEENHNDHDNDDYDDDSDDDDDDDQSSKLQEKRMKMTSNSCFCLSSLQHDDDR